MSRHRAYCRFDGHGQHSKFLQSPAKTLTIVVMRIVQARPAGVERIAPLFAGYLKFYKKRATPAAVRIFLADRLRRRESVIFLAFDGRTPVGFVQLYPTWSSLSLKQLWILNDLFVVPASRKR